MRFRGIVLVTGVVVTLACWTFVNSCKTLDLNNSTHCRPPPMDIDKESKFVCCSYAQIYSETSKTFTDKKNQTWTIWTNVNVTFQPTCKEFGDWGYQCTLHAGDACKLEGEGCEMPNPKGSSTKMCCPPVVAGNLTCLPEGKKNICKYAPTGMK